MFSQTRYMQKNGSTVPFQNIISEWLLTSNANDSVGSNNGVATSTSFDSVNGANFSSSTNSNITIPYSPSFYFGDGISDVPFSISFNLKFNTITTNIFIISAYTNTNRGWRFVKVGNLYYFQLYDKSQSNASVYAIDSLNLSVGVDYHFTYTYSGNVIDSNPSYINGVQTSFVNTVSGSYIASEDVGQPLVFGKLNGSGSWSLNGWLKNIRIWDKQLTDKEVLAIYNLDSN